MNRLLVVVPNWFGETLFTTPFLRALRRQRPNAFIAAMGWPQCREVLLHSPWINEFLAYDEKGRDRGPAGAWRVIRLLRERRFDTAFILRKSLSRSFLLALAGILTRIGFDNPKSGWLLTQRVRGPDPTVHKAASYLPLLTAAGLKPDREPYEYIVSPEEREQARNLLKNQQALDARPLVILHPGANWFHKRWPVDRFAALGNRLAEQQRAHIVVTGGPADAALAAAVVERMHQPAVNLAGQTTLRQLGACLEQAHLVITNDTGVLHIAAAIGRPVIALYGPTSPALTGPLGDSERIVVIHHAQSCPEIPCYHPDRPPHPGMEAITVEEVHEATIRQLGLSARR